MTGFVYQYYFAGQRVSRRAGHAGVEYVFQVSKDRKTSAPVTVFIEDQIFDSWIEDHQRDLRGSHRYGVAKMALRNAFDERPPEHVLEEVMPGAEEVAGILEELDA